MPRHPKRTKSVIICYICTSFTHHSGSKMIQFKPAKNTGWNNSSLSQKLLAPNQEKKPSRYFIWRAYLCKKFGRLSQNHKLPGRREISRNKAVKVDAICKFTSCIIHSIQGQRMNPSLLITIHEYSNQSARKVIEEE